MVRDNASRTHPPGSARACLATAVDQVGRARGVVVLAVEFFMPAPTRSPRRRFRTERRAGALA